MQYYWRCQFDFYELFIATNKQIVSLKSKSIKINQLE